MHKHRIPHPGLATIDHPTGSRLPTLAKTRPGMVKPMATRAAKRTAERMPGLKTGMVALAVVLTGFLQGCHDGSSQVTGTAEKPAEPTTTEEVTSAAGESVDLDVEHLLADVPQGWIKVYESLHDTQRLVEYVPDGSSAENWNEKISFESFSHKPLPDPIELVTSIARDQKETCEGFEDHNTFSGFENGYPTSVRLLICKNDKLSQKGQITLIKTIQGNENFYVITRAERVEPIDEEAEGFDAAKMALWSLHMRAISVCDPRKEEHPCPTLPSAADAAMPREAMRGEPGEPGTSEEPVNSEP